MRKEHIAILLTTWAAIFVLALTLRSVEKRTKMLEEELRATSALQIKHHGDIVRYYYILTNEYRFYGTDTFPSKIRRGATTISFPRR
jgi:hypothetical protein